MRRIIACILASCASAALAADPTPEEVYKKVVDTYSAAKTLHLEGVKSEIDQGTEGKVSLVTSLWIGQEDRVRLDITGKEQDKEHKLLFICDGNRVAVTRDGSPVPSRAEAKGLAALARSSLVKGGLSMAIRTLEAPGGGWRDCAPSDLKAVEDTKVGDRAASGISYTLNFKDGAHEVALEITLWVDKETWKVLKSQLKDASENTFIVETYPSTVFDAKEPDDAFKLPEQPPVGK